MEAGLRVSAAARHSIEAEALQRFPYEACGFLIGPQENVVDEARPSPNLHPGPRERRFLIDGLAYVRLEDELDTSGRRLVGIFHSHPLHPAVPSDTDRQAAWPGLAYVIQEVLAGDRVGSMRAWLLRPDRDGFDEVEFQVG